MNSTLKVASALARLGYRVFPVLPGRKEPAIKEWQLVATSDPEVVVGWFDNDRGLNLGLACGPQPNGRNLLVVDVDPKNGGDVTWLRLLREHGWDDVLGTSLHLTPSGGEHGFFDAPVEFRNSRSKLGPGIDTRGAGGYVVVPPSRLVDGDGVIGVYQAAPGRNLQAAPPVSLPGWIAAALAAPPAVSSPARLSGPSGGFSANGSADRLRERWVWADELSADGWRLVKAVGGDEFWARPGKTDRGHSAVVHPSGVFVVFSTEVPPQLERLGHPTSDGTGFAVSPFEYFAAMRFGGDMSAAGRALAVGQGPGVVPLPDPATDGQPVAVVGDVTSLNLPAEFWGERPVLAHVKAAARAGRCSPDALLVHALARSATFIHPCFKLPGVEQGLIGKPQTLDFLGCVVAETSGGKTLAAGVGELLVPAPPAPLDGSDPVIDFDQKVGSGEGIAEFFLVAEVRPDEDGKLKATGKRVVGKQALFMSVDEGTGFTQQAGRKGTTIIATLASAWSGESLGQLNAADQTRRLVQGGRVRICAVINMQDSNAWKLFAEELESVGFTGRLLFASAHDPSAVDVGNVVWPGPLQWPVRPGNSSTNVFYTYAPAIAAEIIATRDGILTKTVMIDRRQSQYLLLRCKVAAILATWEGRLDVSEDDWRLATSIVCSSASALDYLDEVRAHSQNVTAVTAASFKLSVTDQAETAHIRRLAVGWKTRIVAELRTKGPQTWKQLRELSRADRRPAFRMILEEMVSEGVLIKDGNRYKTA